MKESDIPTWKLFLYSGFYLLILVTVLRTITSNGIQTLTATFLMESYENISPSIGNMLNILIIIAGMLGVILVNQFLYPRLIRNEAIATLVLVGTAIVPVTVMNFVGKVPAFVKYGKNGLASGVSNACAAVAIMLQSYVIVKIADYAGWKMVIYLWIIMLAVSVVCLIITIPMWRRFKRGKKKL